MGWGHCGPDTYGREMGYMVEATCDEPGCGSKIDRGLGYVCGGRIHQDVRTCGGYYCGFHLVSNGREGLQACCKRCAELGDDDEAPHVPGLESLEDGARRVARLKAEGK